MGVEHVSRNAVRTTNVLMNRQITNMARNQKSKHGEHGKRLREKDLLIFSVCLGNNCEYFQPSFFDKPYLDNLTFRRVTLHTNPSLLLSLSKTTRNW